MPDSRCGRRATRRSRAPRTFTFFARPALLARPATRATAFLRGVGVGTVAAVLAVIPLVSGCSDRAEAPTLTVADSAGIRIVTAHGGGWDAGAAWRLERDLEVGAREGPQAFGRLLDVAPRRAGGVWVVDAQERRIRGFDETGTEVLAFGRAGMGPGEFKSVGPVTEDADGVLAIGGRMPVELYRFDERGESLDTRPVPPEAYRDATAAISQASDRPPVGPTMAEWRFAADGSPFLQAVTLDVADGDIVQTGVLVRIGTPGRPAARFARWETPAVSGGPGGEMHLLQPTASWHPLSDGGVWFSSGEAYELRRHDDAGAVATILRRPVPRPAVTRAVRERFLAMLEAEADTPGMRAMLERAEFPDSLPATVGLWVSEPGGDLWVGVVDETLPLRREGPNALDVFAPDGQYRGRVPLPEGFRPTRITPGHLYGVWLDELEVSHARRYRIVRDG